MIRFTATIKKFASQGEKTGWTYIDVPSGQARKLIPENRKGFRVKGKLDKVPFKMKALLPMGNGDFILTLDAGLRKKLQKPVGTKIEIQMVVDHTEILPPAELMECLADEPEALEYFNSITRSHQNYFTNWINSAKTDTTKASRIAVTINALSKKWDFGRMLRERKKEKF